jgi:hypothetical protein
MRQLAALFMGRGDPLVRGVPYGDSAKPQGKRSQSVDPRLENLRQASPTAAPATAWPSRSTGMFIRTVTVR